ncbi:MAG: DUF4363 family protein [Oscillospiraceae bacterium]|jgi:hypothetical protein|nr:DUF4363 family protein [Oscillospiraceae bacterium]
MKKELFAAALLIALSTLSAFNLRYLRALTLDMTSKIDAACAYAADGLWDSAAAEAGKAEEAWSSALGYASVFIRHAEADGVSDAFCELLGAIYGKDRPAVLRSAMILKKHVSGLYDMERPSLGSIL